MNGNGGGGGGKPCAGCVGNADNKFPPGQAPNGSDHNNGYECDGNSGVGKTNPAHSGCKAPAPPRCVESQANNFCAPPPQCIKSQANNFCGPPPPCQPTAANNFCKPPKVCKPSQSNNFCKPNVLPKRIVRKTVLPAVLPVPTVKPQVTPLPFTGADVTPFFILGLCLMVIGALLAGVRRPTS